MIFNRLIKITAGLVGLLLIGVLSVNAQNTKIISSFSHYRNGEEAEKADEQNAVRYDSLHIMEAVQKTTGASTADMNLFRTYYVDTLSNDRQAFINELGGNIFTRADIEQYARAKEEKYVKMYQKLQEINKEFPSTVDEYTNHTYSNSLPGLPPGTCNPACTNIGFETGDLSGWNAYDAANNSPPLSMSYTGITGGPCGAVKKAAMDTYYGKYKSDTCYKCLPYKPDTTYQVTITNAGNDPIAGALVPMVAPGGGNHSCRIGDSSVGGSRVGILQQTFSVTPSNENFTYQYAVFIDQATHSFGQQPYLSITITDQTTGDTLPCGKYLIASGGIAPKGFDSTTYTIPTYGWTDPIYFKPWTSVYVPLQNYLGHCISVQVTVSDCYPSAIGPHFCYAYFDASCGPLATVTASPSCANDTLTAPAGGTYKWAGPCISGSSTNQSAVVTCSGTYTVTITSPDGCADTIQKTITILPPMAITDSTKKAGCNITGSATVYVSGGSGTYTYSWSNGATNAKDTGLAAGTYTATVSDNSGCTETLTAIVGSSAETAAPGPLTNPACFGDSTGKASVTTVGGKSPYTYSWTPSGQTNATATGLGAGTYTVSITDGNGCSTSVIISITQPSQITASTAPTNIVCNGGNNGSAIATAGGGVSGYTYSWTPSGQTGANATGLSAGTYTVNITDATGCTTSVTATITQPLALAAAMSPISVSCDGGSNGSATVNVSGGTGPYTYSWSPTNGTGTTISGLTAGSYTVNITDNSGCTATAAVTVGQPAKLTATLSAPPQICSGNTTTVSASASGGQPGYTYKWNNGMTTDSINVPAPPAQYFCTVTDSCGDVATDTINLKVNPVHPVSACCNTTIKQGDDTTIVASGKDIAAYKWQDSSKVVCLDPPLCDSVKVSPTVTTTYTVIGLDSSGCEVESVVTIDVKIPCFNFTVPNVFTPTYSGLYGVDDVFYIKTTNLDSWSIIVYDRWGKVMFQTTNQYNYWDGNTKSGGKAPAGVYYYIITGTCQGNTYKKDGYLQLIR